jgi:hypothetical protein
MINGFDQKKAGAVIASLKLSAEGRRFADLWLSHMSEDGQLDECGFNAAVEADIEAQIVSFEITPHMVRIKSAGARIVETVGHTLVGEDYLLMAPPAQRATRLMRFSQIAEGCISRHQRWVVNTAGKVHFINELAMPCGLSENELPMIMTYIDADSQSSLGRIPMKKGVRNIAPIFETYAVN